MELNDIKKWLTDPGERFIFIEEGEPAYVVLGFEAYKILKGGKGGQNLAMPPEDPIDLANARLEIERAKAKELAAKLSMPKAEPEEEIEMRDPAEIRLEDLPL
ncbi:MAG: hypothetical protein HYT40_00190 [Candidatus Sungbacteria bacterium]|uniref:Uncharacterized protein n=1 Tax=Candidatus Sungiibacteriota bacterium TaxID=2750080 RepID=A0A931SAT7_9BACT|nr:hypothetical protein [Candidatus Sungbacteria bacterium]